MSKKDAILQAATVLFSKNGFKETSTADLAKMINVAEGTIFYHFKTKDKLFLAVLEQTKKNDSGRILTHIWGTSSLTAVWA